MHENRLLLKLKIIMVVGLLMVLTGHVILSYTDIPEIYGVKGFMSGAMLIAFGLILSLPTKMYLTFLFVTRENSQNKDLKCKAEYKQGPE